MKSLCFISFLLLALSSALGAERVALVIGNNRYTNLADNSQLKSPVADATDVAVALKSLGYTLVTGGAVTDASRESMTTATESFAAQAKNAEAAVFYYSGHGVQIGEDNYLLPSDAPRLTGLAVLKNRAVLLRDSVMVALEEAGVKTKVIILDCCRDNPFQAQLETALAQVGKSIKTKGVGEITGYGPGFYLAFATSPGTSAEDGNGQRNSPFTAAMLKMLPGSSGKDIDFLFRDVKALLGESQVSWTNHSLQGNFALARDMAAKMEQEPDALAMEAQRRKAEELAKPQTSMPPPTQAVGSGLPAPNSAMPRTQPNAPATPAVSSPASTVAKDSAPKTSPPTQAGTVSRPPATKPKASKSAPRSNESPSDIIKRLNQR